MSLQCGLASCLHFYHIHIDKYCSLHHGLCHYTQTPPHQQPGLSEVCMLPYVTIKSKKMVGLVGL